MKVLVMGASARAVAYSVAKAGHEPVGMDHFGDRDLRKIAKWRRLDKSIPLAVTAGALAVEGAVFASGVENHPEMITALESAGVKVFSSPRESIERCRSLDELGKFCEKNDFARPRTRKDAPPDDDGALWLLKRVKSGAGAGVRNWEPGLRPADGEYLQELIDGVPLSAVFLADGEEAVLCGASRQLAGDASLGADGYAWCGNVMPFEAPPEKRHVLLSELRRLAGAAASYFGLRGAAGADCILKGETLFVLEINPRMCASFELVELMRGMNIFGLHMRALDGDLPEEPPGLLDGPFRGKGIVYAPRNSTAPDTGAWYSRSRRDIPRPGSPLPAGAPICTVLTGPCASGSEVMERLADEAARVWEECGI
jgi:predicted ATP-grasp superfamily ATP-dependent carboligase